MSISVEGNSCLRSQEYSEPTVEYLTARGLCSGLALDESGSETTELVATGEDEDLNQKVGGVVDEIVDDN